jgi:hypothetical protein
VTHWPELQVQKGSGCLVHYQCLRLCCSWWMSPKERQEREAIDEEMRDEAKERDRLSKHEIEQS